MMHQQMQFIFICSLLCATIVASNEIIDTPKESQQQQSTTVELPSDDVSSRSRSSVPGVPFETSHKAPYQSEFQTSHKISHDALQQREELHQSMRSKEKPELDEQLAELIAADIKSNIEAKRLSEYEKYVIEPLTTEKPTLTTTTEEGIAQSINDGLIDDFSVLEEAGSENKQQSRIQIKKGPNGQDYEYEYVYYYYDDDEAKNPEDSDVIIANRKSPSTSSTTTTTQAPAVSSGKASYASIERGSSVSSGERNEIQSRGKGRAQALPAPVVEEITDDRLPPATRFPQRGKSVNSVQAVSSENVAPEIGKKHHPKRPSLELVDSQVFISDEKDKNLPKGPRIVESELTRSELHETVSKSSVEYASSTIESPEAEEEEEDTTPSMEKATFDLYAHIANENANADEKKINSVSDLEVTTVEVEDLTTARDDCEDCSVPSSSVSTTAKTEAPTTTTTTEATTTTTTTTTTQAPTELPRGRGAVTAGRASNRFKFQGRTTTTEAAAEATEAPKTGKNRFQKPSFGGSRAARPTKTTAAPVEEAIVKSEVPQSSTGNKFRSSGARNRFSLRGKDTLSTEKSAADVETTTASRLVKPQRPQFSLRNRSRASSPTSSTEAPQQANTESNAENEQDDKTVEKSSASPIVPRPTSRLNINRPGSRVISPAISKSRPSPVINRSRVNSNVENNDDNKSTAENESDAESTTQNNLNKIKSRPRIQVAESKAKKTTAQPVINRKANPLISKRKFGVTSTTEAAVDEHDENESDNATKEGAKDASESANELKEEETTQAVEVTSEQPRGLGLLNRRKLVANNRRPGTIN